MNGANLSQSACVCEDEDTTTLPKKCARRSVDVVAGVRIVKCHASMDVVIDTQAYMSSLAFALCFVTHSYIILVFPLRVQILILLSCSNNSS